MSSSRVKKIVVLSQIKSSADQICERYTEGTYSPYTTYTNQAAYYRDVSSSLKLALLARRIPIKMDFSHDTDDVETAILLIDIINKDEMGSMEFTIKQLMSTKNANVNCVALAGYNASKNTKKPEREILNQMHVLQKKYGLESTWLIDAESNYNISQMFNHVALLPPLADLKHTVKECAEHFKDKHADKSKIEKINALISQAEQANSYPKLRSAIILLQNECKLSWFPFHKNSITPSLNLNKVFDGQGNLRIVNLTQPSAEHKIEMIEMKDELRVPLNSNPQSSDNDELENENASCCSALFRKLC